MIRRTFAMAMIAMVFVVATPGLASAQGVGASAPASTTGCNTDPKSRWAEWATNSTAEKSSDYLPINRWIDSTGSLHSRLGKGALDDLDQKGGRTLTGFTISIGNAAWSTGTSVVELAASASVLDKTGCMIDEVAGATGKSLLDSGILSLGVVVTIIAVLWRQYRGSGTPGSAVMRTIAILTLFGIMMNGAMQTSRTNVISFGSPAWIATKSNDLLGSLASAPAAALAEVAPEAGSFSTIDSGGDNLSCSAYTRALKAKYKELWGTKFEQPQATAPLVMSSMWEESGLALWASVQFGEANPYGQRVYCRLLERNRKTKAVVQRNLMKSVLPVNGSNGTRRVYSGGSPTEVDKQMIGWAACTPNGSGGWTVSGFTEADLIVDKHPAITAEDCKTWWDGGGDLDGAVDAPSNMDWEDDPDLVDGATKSPATADYVAHLHGDAAGSGLVGGFVYMFVGFIMFLVFGALALAVFGAKIVAAVMMLMVMVNLGISLFTVTSGNDRLTKFAKSYLAISAYGVGFQFILGLVAVISKIIIVSATPSLGAGSILATILAGLAPIISVVVMHVSIKAMGLTSPFQPSAMKEFASAAGGAGVGAFAGMSLGRMMGRRGGSGRFSNYRLRRAVGRGQRGRAVSTRRQATAKDQADLKDAKSQGRRDRLRADGVSGTARRSTGAVKSAFGGYADRAKAAVSSSKSAAKRFLDNPKAGLRSGLRSPKLRRAGVAAGVAVAAATGAPVIAAGGAVVGAGVLAARAARRRHDPRTERNRQIIRDYRERHALTEAPSAERRERVRETVQEPVRPASRPNPHRATAPADRPRPPKPKPKPKTTPKTTPKTAPPKP